MDFGKSTGNFSGSAVRLPFGHDSAAVMWKLVALLPKSMQIVHNWSEKGEVPINADTHALVTSPSIIAIS